MVALFAIISFFAVNVGRVFLVGEVKGELDKYALTINGMVAAPPTCDSNPFAIPPKFVSFGNNVFYTLKITRIPDPTGNRLIFSVSDVRSPTTTLAASSLATTANIVVLDNSTGTFIPLNPNEELELNPQSVPPRNAFYGVKSVKNGITTLYIFPCSISANSNTCTGPTGAKAQVNSSLPIGEQFTC